MSDYIKREDAERMFMEYLCAEYHIYALNNDIEADKRIKIAIKISKEMFSHLKSADVAPVRHGRWEVIDAEEPRRYGCSECKRLSWHMENYCPSCGARMDGEDDEL